MTSSRSGGVPSSIRRTAAAIGGCGLPATTGDRPDAAATAATMAPAPGIGPAGVGKVASALVAMSRAPLRTAVAAMRIRS